MPFPLQVPLTLQSTHKVCIKSLAFENRQCFQLSWTRGWICGALLAPCACWRPVLRHRQRRRLPSSLSSWSQNNVCAWCSPDESLPWCSLSQQKKGESGFSGASFLFVPFLACCCLAPFSFLLHLQKLQTNTNMYLLSLITSNLCSYFKPVDLNLANS